MPKDTVQLVADGLAQVGQARSDVVAAFDHLARSLEAANDGLEKVARDVARLNELMAQLGDDRGAGPDFPALSEEVAGLLAAQADELGKDALGRDIAGAVAATGTIMRETRQLTMLATLSRITGTAVGVSHINGFVASLRDMTGALRAATVGLETALTAILERRSIALDQMRAAADSAAEAQQIVAHARGGNTDLRRRHAKLSQGVGVLSDRLEATVRAETSTLIAGIQHADELSQRLEHVRAILSDPGADTVAARALAAAQIDAACSDTHAVLGRLRKALSRMRENGRNAGETLAGDIGAEAAALLDGLSGELAQAARLEAFLGPALSTALEAAGAVRDRVAQGQSDLSRLRCTAEAITLASVNAGLLADRSGVSKAAMDVLSRTVRESAALCSAQTGACEDAFARIDGLVDSPTLPRLQDRTAALQAALAEAQARHRAVAGGLRELSDLRDNARTAAAALSAAVEAGLTALATLPAAVDALRRCGTVLDPTDPVPTAALETLAPLMEIYTMQCEREVQARLCGEETASPTPAAAQSLDDIFF